MGPEAEAEFRVFVAARSGALLRTARLLVGNPHAEDLVQEALARLVPKWDGVDDPEAYVRVTMHRLQISRWRRRAVIREDAVETLPPGRLADHARVIDDRVVLRGALARLSARQRAVLVCRYVEDLDENETARMLGIRVGTVRSIAFRALARLRQIAPELAAFRPGRTPVTTPSSGTAAPGVTW
jgi:RNA polymerase sigma-70 factor (sigma-E family)